MSAEKKIENVNIVFKEKSPAESKEEQNVEKEHMEVGVSSLYGLRDNNITFHSQGVSYNGYWERMWHWVWKDLGFVFYGIVKVIFSREK